MMRAASHSRLVWLLAAQAFLNVLVLSGEPGVVPAWVVHVANAALAAVGIVLRFEDLARLGGGDETRPPDSRSPGPGQPPVAPGAP